MIPSPRRRQATLRVQFALKIDTSLSARTVRTVRGVRPRHPSPDRPMANRRPEPEGDTQSTICMKGQTNDSHRIHRRRQHGLADGSQPARGRPRSARVRCLHRCAGRGGAGRRRRGDEPRRCGHRSGNGHHDGAGRKARARGVPRRRRQRRHPRPRTPRGASGRLLDHRHRHRPGGRRDGSGVRLRDDRRTGVGRSHRCRSGHPHLHGGRHRGWFRAGQTGPVGDGTQCGPPRRTGARPGHQDLATT